MSAGVLLLYCQHAVTVSLLYFLYAVSVLPGCCDGLREEGHGFWIKVASKTTLQRLRAMHVWKLQPGKALVPHEHVCLLGRQRP